MKKMKRMMSVALMVLPMFMVACDKEVVLPVQDCPKEIKGYVAEHFPTDPIIQVIKDIDVVDLNYDVTLKSMTKLEFTRDSKVKKIKAPWGEEAKLPDSVLPESIRKYVAENFPGTRIIEWQLDKKGTTTYQEVELNTGIELIFDANGIFYRLGD